jgi:sucrose-6F-phosphate phosphohydrolase
MLIKFLSFDIDGTLLGNPETLHPFKKIWSQIDPEQRPQLCYNSGRLLDDTLRLVRTEHLPEPDYIISGVGTNIYDVKNKQTLKAFSEILEEGWDLARVETVLTQQPYDLTKQPQHFQNPFKSSWFFENASYEQITDIEKQLETAGLDVNVIYSSSLHFDVLPKWANKGNALLWLLKHKNIKPEEAIVAGDSGNDSAMFLLSAINGIIVGNAQPELYQATKHLPLYHAEKTFSEGVLEGLIHYNVLPETSFDPASTPANDPLTQEMIHFLDGGEAITGLDEEQVAFIRVGYEKAVEALKKNITPLGFSACSLADNETRGTDENYYSVWARDGSMAIVGSIPLVHDEEIRQCQQRTLETLLNYISPNGQIPANVRIADERPDYSGVGGICSIDSGLWLIIAFYEYVKATRDLDFLRQYIGTLQKAMDWLSAHDGNNDALLEIPEAGDWTDLFGRSYNVLYDEVLWYRANICFGRLLEMLGDSPRAGDYLRWSQVIKKEILLNFWPSTQLNTAQTVTFDEQQYSLGDATYLIAQITPFDFSWRCDIYGNVLAYLYDVIDSEKALLAFRFMWGVGVNEPYPVANVYPAVTVGDQDWRRYYTVNLLNLPHHYHNGGIWPFVGAAWVRFIHKLGLRELALQELYKLTHLNKLGIHQAWEFNEWAHGKTGRPMGKVYQAWSASEYILTCHTLKVVDEKRS